LDSDLEVQVEFWSILHDEKRFTKSGDIRVGPCFEGNPPAMASEVDPP
jgi:hypothetical protein